MDSKRWYSRFGTIFWWSLAILPLIVTLIHFIGFHLAFNSGIATSTDLLAYQNDDSGNFITLLILYTNKLQVYCVPYIRTMFVNVFQQIGVQFGPPLSLVGTLFGWMTSVAFYHVLFDFSVWIFNWIHALFDKWGCFK